VTLAEKVAVVTGAASGIGRAIAFGLARAGAAVAVVDVNLGGAEETVRAIETEGGRARAWQADVARRSEVDAVVAGVLAAWGAVHILVNNAGWDRPMPFVETTEEFWDKVLAVNLKGPIICTRAVLPPMIAQGYGKIVSVASDAGRVGSTGEAVYSAAKGGVIAFTKAVAREVARHRINVNCVCPGPSDTPLFRTEFVAVNPKLSASLARVIPWGRLGQPDDVAPAVVFLASDEAGYVTGQTLSVSGGLTMA
jgi:2-hydroxycyclohexanecarboxyl-CoA dehydrogenase